MTACWMDFLPMLSCAIEYETFSSNSEWAIATSGPSEQNDFGFGYWGKGMPEPFLRVITSYWQTFHCLACLIWEGLN